MLSSPGSNSSSSSSSSAGSKKLPKLPEELLILSAHDAVKAYTKALETFKEFGSPIDTYTVKSSGKQVQTIVCPTDDPKYFKVVVFDANAPIGQGAEGTVFIGQECHSHEN